MCLLCFHTQVALKLAFKSILYSVMHNFILGIYRNSFISSECRKTPDCCTFQPLKASTDIFTAAILAFQQVLLMTLINVLLQLVTLVFAYYFYI